eukprot:g14128.t1
MGAAHFSAIFVEPRADELGDAFLTWLLHGTTPEYWFQIYERVADKDSVSQCDILHAMGDDAEDFAFAISLCHRLETFFGCRTFVAGAPTTGPASGADPDREAREAATEPPLSFSVSPVELFGALILLAGTGTPGMGGMGEGAPGAGVPRTPNSRFALLQQEFLTAAAASGLFVPVVAASSTSSVRPAAGTTSSSAAATGIAKASPFLNASANPLAWEYRRSPGMQKRYPGSFQAVAGTTYRVNEVYDLALGGANKIAMPAGASYPAPGAGPRSCGDLQSDKRAALTSLAGGGLLVAGSGGEGGRGGEGHHAPPSFKDGKHHSKAALLTNHNQGAKQSAAGALKRGSNATAVGAGVVVENENDYTGVGKLREQRYQVLYEQLKCEPVHVRIQLLQSGKLCNSTTSTGSTSSATTPESSAAILALLTPFGFGAAPGGGGGGGLAGGAVGAGGLTSSGATSKAALSRSASRAMIAEKSFHRAGSILTGSDQRRGSGGKRPHNRAAGGGGGGMTVFGYGSCGAGVAAAGNIAALMSGVAGRVVHASGSGTIGNSTGSGTLTSDGGAANSAAAGAPPSTSSQLEWLLAHYLATLQAQQQAATIAAAGAASNKFAAGAGTRTPPPPAGTSTKKVSEPDRGGDSTVLNSVLDAVVFADLFRASRRRSGSCPAELRRPRGAQARGGGGQRQQQAVPDYLQPHSTYNTFNLRGSVANRGRVDAQSVRRVELLLHMARGRAMCSSNSTRRGPTTTSSHIRARGKRTTMWLSQLKTLLYQLHRGVLMFAHGSSPFAMDEVDHCLAPLLKKKAPTLLELSTEEALCLSVSSSSSADHKVVGSKNYSATSSWCSRPFGGRSPAQFFQRAQGLPSSRPPASGQQLHRPGRGPGPPDFEFRVADFFDYLEHESDLLHERNWPASRVAFVQEGCALKLAQHRLLRIGRRLETIHGKKLVRNALTESTRSLEENNEDTNQEEMNRHDVELYNINRVTDGGSKGHSSKNSKDQDLHDHGADGGSIANSSSAGLENVNVAGADQDRAAVMVRSGGVVAPPTTTSSAKNGRVDQYEFAQLSWQKVQSVWSRVTALDDVLPKILDRARALCAERGVPFLLGGEPCGAAAVGAGGPPGGAGAPGGGGAANHAVNATIGTPMIGGGPRNWNGGRGGGALVESNRAGKPAGSTSRSTGVPTTTVSSSADVSFEYRYADLNTYDLTLLLVPALVLDQLLITEGLRNTSASMPTATCCRANDPTGARPEEHPLEAEARLEGGL